MASRSEGARAVALAREAIAYGLSHSPVRDAAAPFRTLELPAIFDEARGVFVTLTTSRDGSLRGCVGFPGPVHPLRLALPRAAWAAAVDDPRFPPVSAPELLKLLIEVSILTPPEAIPPHRSLPDEVSVGRDGLIIERDGESGILLPQVAAEERWSSVRFLAETCRKAGLGPDDWRRPGTSVSRFRAELFRERAPGAPAEPRTLSAP